LACCSFSYVLLLCPMGPMGSVSRNMPAGGVAVAVRAGPVGLCSVWCAAVLAESCQMSERVELSGLQLGVG
jgi:hypothetical protein